MEEVLLKRPAEQKNLEIIENTKEDLYPGQKVNLDFVEDGKDGEGIADDLADFYLMEGH